MNDISYHPFVEQVVRAMGLRKPVQFVRFIKNQVATPPVSLNIPIIGYFLRIAPEQCAVIIAPDGQPKVLEAGDHLLRWPAGAYLVYYVNQKMQFHELPAIHALTSDGWEMELRIAITWKVRSPDKVITLANPFGLLSAATHSIAIDFIQSKTHNELLPTKGSQTAMSGSQISGFLSQQLQANPALGCLEFISVEILDRRGESQTPKT